MRGVLRPPLARSFLSDFWVLALSIGHLTVEKALSCPDFDFLEWLGVFFRTPFTLQLLWSHL